MIGAAQLALLPFSGDVSARPSDYIQSRPGEDKITKFPGKPSVSGNQAREPSSKGNSSITSGEKPAADARAETALDANKV